MKRVLFGLLLGLAVLYAISRQLDFGAVRGVIAAASLPLLLLSLFAEFVSLWLKGERWAVAIAPKGGRRPRRRLFASMLIGTAGNIVLPARVGDVARAFVLRKHNGTAVPQALTASWSVQVLDFLVVALLLWALSPSSGFASRAALLAIVAAASGILLGLVLVRRFPGLLRLVGRLPRWASRRIQPLIESAHEGLAFLDTGSALVRVVVLTGAVWGAEAVAYTAALRAFGLVLPLAVGPFLAAAIGLSFVLPLTPGSLGTFQLVSIFVLGAFGVAREPAFAFGLGYQAVAQLSVLVCGFVALQREGLDWRSLPKTTEGAAGRV